MLQTPHVAWVTTLVDGTPRRLELRAIDSRDCIRRALAAMPHGSRASCRATDQVEPVTVERRTS